jgi:2-oxoglutarate ferredoxin oxidoreductase subunit delta
MVASEGSPVKVLIDPDKCKGDGLCVDLCPVHVFEVRTVSRKPKKTRTVVANDAACIFCKICEVNCPNLAIKVILAEL